MLDFWWQVEMDDANIVLIAVLNEFCTLLFAEEEMFGAIHSPILIASPADNPHFDERIYFLSRLADPPGFRHFFNNLLRRGIPEDFAILDQFFGLILTLVGNAKEEVIERC